LSPSSQMISRVAEAEILFSERGQPYDMTRPICHVTFHVLTVDVTQITLLYYPRRCKNPKDRNAISFTVTTQMYPCPLLYVVVSCHLYTLQHYNDLKTSTQKQITGKSEKFHSVLLIVVIRDNVCTRLPFSNCKRANLYCTTEPK